MLIPKAYPNRNLPFWISNSSFYLPTPHSVIQSFCTEMLQGVDATSKADYNLSLPFLNWNPMYNVQITNTILLLNYQLDIFCLNMMFSSLLSSCKNYTSGTWVHYYCKWSRKRSESPPRSPTLHCSQSQILLLNPRGKHQ